MPAPLDLEPALAAQVTQRIEVVGVPARGDAPDVSWLTHPEPAILAMFDDGTRKRGYAVLRKFAVRYLKVSNNGDTVEALVDSTSDSAYVTRWVRSPGSSWAHTQCSCPIAFSCKHAFAVLVATRACAALWEAPAEPPWWEAAQLARTLTGMRAAVTDDEPLPFGVRIITGPDHTAQLVPLRRTVKGNWSAATSWNKMRRAPEPPSAAHTELWYDLRDLVFMADALRSDPWNNDYITLASLPPLLLRRLAELVRQGLYIDHRGAYAAKPHAVRVAPEPLNVQVEVLRNRQTDELTPFLRFGALDGPVICLGDPIGAVLRETDEATVWHMVQDGPPRTLVQYFAGTPEQLAVPTEREEEFLAEVVPALQAHMPVVAGDNTVPIFEVNGPALLVRVAHSEFGTATVNTTIGYDLGDVLLEPTQLPPNLAGNRDQVAERAILDSLSPISQAMIGLDVPGEVFTHDATLEGEAYRTLTEQVLPELQGTAIISEQGPRPVFTEVGKDLEFVAEVDPDPDRTDWFELAMTIRVAGSDDVVPLSDAITALAQGRTELHLSHTGNYVDLTRSEFAALRELVAEARLYVPDNSTKLSMPAANIDWWFDLLEQVEVSSQSTAWKERLATWQKPLDRDVPDWFAADLRPYQRDGVQWLTRLWSGGMGGILADDMGLGKTIQVLAAIAAMKTAGELRGPVLVVAPTSVVHNWAREAERFAPQLRVATLDATFAKSRVKLAELASEVDVIVTSYSLVRLDSGHYAKVPLAAMVCDEAQLAKNPRTALYAALVRVRAEVKFALTGTPLENSLADVWSIATLTSPGLLPKLVTFRTYYQRPIEHGTRPERLEQLLSRLRPFFLRRTKDVVAADLPPKSIHILDVTLSDEHRRIYNRALRREQQNILGLLADENGRKKVDVLAGLTRLRRLCLDVSITREKTDKNVPSAKVEILGERLEQLAREGHKALVFSQFTDFLDVIGAELKRRGVVSARLDGSTRRRDDAVAQFRDDDTSVFCISLKAGGFGLTLTEADYVFITDPWWNPAAEMQAIDRTHRIGQDKPVTVYRLVALDTIEERVVALQQRKQELFDHVVGEAPDVPVALSDADITALLDGGVA